jgi:hypothetical protein
MSSPNWEEERPIFALSGPTSTSLERLLTNDKSRVGEIVPGTQFIAMLDTQII